MYDFHVYFYILSEIILYTIYSTAFYCTLSEINLYKLYSAAFESFGIDFECLREKLARWIHCTQLCLPMSEMGAH